MSLTEDTCPSSCRGQEQTRRLWCVVVSIPHEGAIMITSSTVEIIFGFATGIRSSYHRM